VKRLAFAYHPRSFATLEISEAAAGICEVVWVIDRAMPEVRSMARLLTRLGEVVDVTGLDAAQAAAAIRAARPDGILALSDAMLEWTADIAARLDLPHFHAPATARRLADKRAQREALAAAGIPVPASWAVPPTGDGAGWRALLDAVVFPAVVKPRRSEVSRNTLPVRSAAELEAALAGIAARSPQDRDALQLEEYLADRPGAPGAGEDALADYLSVETAVVGGEPRHFAVNGRLPLATPFRETGFFIPAALAEDERDAALALATAAVGALGVTTGVLHTEIKMTPDGPRIIEVNGRIGGGVIDMMRRATGLEVMPVALRLALGERPDVPVLPATDGVAYILLRQPSQTLRHVTAIDGLDELRARADVDQVLINRGPGARIDWQAGTNEYVFRVDGRVPDHDALLDVRRHAEHGVRVSGDCAAPAVPATP
jgi:biotin carboxylase